MVGPFTLPSLCWALDVYEIYQKALNNDPEYREAVESYLSKREAKWQGISGLLPRVEFRAAIDRVSQEKKIDSQAESSEVDYLQKDYEVRLSQPLFDAEKFALLEKGKREEVQAGLELELARQELKLRVVEAFFDALYADDVLRAYEAQKKATFEFMDQAQKSFKIGTVTVSDVYDAQSRFEMVSAKVMQAEVDRELKLKKLRILTGEPVDFIFPLTHDFKLGPPQPNNMQTWLTQAGSGNLEVQIQNFTVAIAASEVAYNKAGHYPRVELTANLNLNDQSASMSSFQDEGPGQHTSDTYVGLLATVPLFEGGYVMSRVREAEHAKAASSEKLDLVRQESVERARESFVNMIVGAKKIETLRAAIAASKDSLRASKLGYGVGVRTAVDVLNAQEQLSQALREQAKAIYDAVLYSLKLKASTGSLIDEDLMQLRAYTDYSGRAASSAF